MGSIKTNGNNLCSPNPRKQIYSIKCRHCAHAHVHKCACAPACAYVCMHVRMHVRMCTCMCTCFWVHFIWCVYVTKYVEVNVFKIQYWSLNIIMFINITYNLCVSYYISNLIKYQTWMQLQLHKHLISYSHFNSPFMFANNRYIKLLSHSRKT